MKKVIITQIRSDIGRAPNVRRTLESLGLGAIGKRKELAVNESVQGMIKKVAYLLTIENVK